ncbi:TPA: winged helix-turn-helix domain-containing protein, partial [Candidatus Poribacteria bacterium]|nr:winged helix-turn-helix domain-containing protein [Candidatus Poribacteria bacterium]
MAKVPFHVQHNTTPDKLGIILKLYRSKSSISASELAERLGLAIGTVQHILPFVREMHLIGEGGLTDIGRDIADLSVKEEEIWCEAVHVWFYTLHLIHREAYPSWSYARVVDWLWDKEEVELSASVRDRIVGE